MQAEPWIMSAGQDEPKFGRWAHQQPLELTQRLPRPKLVQVVDDQPDALLEQLQVLDQARDDGPAVYAWGRCYGPHQV